MPEVLPLFLFFESLRQNDFPLGIGDYEKFLRGLQLFGGLNYDNYNTFLKTLRQRSSSPLTTLYPKEQLLHLAKMVWLKPNQSEQLFEDLFEENYFYDLLLLRKRDKVNEGLEERRETSFESGERQEREAKQSNENESPQMEENIEEYLNGDQETDFSTISVRISVSEQKASQDLNVKLKPEIEKSKFLFTKNYFPIDKRKVQQNFKLFPAFRFTRSSHEPDVTATIAKTIEKGFFNEVVYKKIKSNSTHLLLLIDSRGSMVAFDHLTKTIKSALQNVLSSKEDRSNKGFQTLYFTNALEENFYVNAVQTKGVSLIKTLDSLRSKSACVIIVSDAGAARGGYNRSRVQTTINFLRKIHNCTHKIVWLNPLSIDRWLNTSAEDIANYVAMFEATEKGIRNAVDFLKGNSTKSIKML
jgi:uncharacterized protein with von Willebrand factor type A (vWA) domain